MSDSSNLEELRVRIEAGYPLVAVETWEETRWENELANLADEIDRGVVTWSLTSGLLPAWESGFESLSDPAAMLDALSAYPEDHIFILKDLHTCWQSAVVTRKLLDLAQSLPDRRQTIIFMASGFNIPTELQKEVLVLSLPLPGLEELHQTWQDVLAERGTPFEITLAQEERLLQGALGLTAREAHRALQCSIIGRQQMSNEVYSDLIAEKRHLVSGSDFLEFYDLDDGIANVGGLDNLKDWLRQRSEAFTREARDQNIPLPKGMLLLGVQGCGKSLTARASAALLHFPLVRLDASHLLSADQGESERNMKQVLRVLELIAPTVLWIDELEKGFAGLGHDSGGVVDATMSRLFGQFLTWMEQRESPVFTVATANSVDQLPPELLRKGRFDELFFVDLPNWHERQDIFKIHIEKRGWKSDKYDLEALSTLAEGYSGAEIEQAVASALLESYTRKQMLSQEGLKTAIEDTVPLSVTMEEKIFQLREWANGRCRQATPDSRVVQMLEEEDRTGGSGLETDDSDEKAIEWRTLAEYGQIRAALVAFVTGRDRATFTDIQNAFADFMPTAGKQGLALRADPNLVLWSGYSAELASLLVSLVGKRRLFLHKGSTEMYTEEGNSLDLPISEEIPDSKVERPTWFPSYLTHFPNQNADQRLSRIARIQLTK